MFIPADNNVDSPKNSCAYGPFGPFDPRDLDTPGLKADIIRWFLANPQWWLAILRDVCPIVRFKRWALITRFDDVQEVLGLDDVFPVPFGEKVKLLDDGPNFLLGMRDGQEYRQIQKDVMDVFAIKDIAPAVVPEAARLSREIVAESRGSLDAVEGLITLVPTRLCETYFGVPIREEIAFGQWTIAMSTFMFGDPTNNPAFRRCAIAAGERLRVVINDAIAAERRAPSGRDTALTRFLAMQPGRPNLTDSIVRSYLIGMITGFVPTNTMAAGHMLQVLFKRKDMFAAARAAALANDDERLRRCLFEAMRFMPLNLGPFRTCARDYTVAAGSRHAKTLKKGDNLLVSTQSAMFDERRVDRPWDFDPDRPAFHSMLFGYGLHWCTGAFMAAAQITQTMKALLIQPKLRPAQGDAGRMKLLGPFPQHLTVEFGS
jgi:cytochrome P450